MDKELIGQLTLWHEDDEHQKIVDTLMEIPPEDRDYEVVSSLARAYNNLGRYEEALEQFARIAKQGQNDCVWHYRVGYSYYYLNRYEEAVREFGIAHELDPDDENTAMLLDFSQRKLRKEQRAAARRAIRERHNDAGTAAAPFEGMDLSNFWDDSDYALREYVSAPPTDELIASVEEELGYKLPASYITLMKQHNGGVPYHTCFPTEDATSWAEDHIAITGIMNIGREKSYSLCGELGSPFMIEEWGYPDIGVVICDCPSAGHDVVMLDYRNCGRDGEPEVVHVDQEDNYEITFLAPDFETFIRGLVSEEEYDTSEEDKEEDLRKVAVGQFSPLLAELCSRVPEVNQLEQKIRKVCTRIVEEKGHFSFHADELSTLMYDVQFWLYTSAYPNTSRQQYLDVYEKMIAFGGEFGQGGYAPGWISDWLDGRIREGLIIQEHGTLSFTGQARLQVIARLEAEAAEEEVIPVRYSHSQTSPVKNKVGSIFVPVRNLERSRSWYCKVLGLNEEDCNIINGHLCPLPMEGTGIILDTMPKWGGDQPGGPPSIETPAFMLMTDDLSGSLDYMKKTGVELVTEIEHDHWFVVKDPDGNKLMIAKS